jgi:hypothetical protein
MTDRNLQARVIAELAWEPKVDSADIAVSAEGSVVTLCGTVSSVGQKHQAQNAAQRVGGVSGISNQLLVRVLDSGRGAGAAALRAFVWQAFMLGVPVPRQHGGSGR